MTLPLYPPDYCDRATLAYRLGVEHGCIDQMVRRGEIPPPVAYSGAERWRWIDVDEWLRRLQTIPGFGLGALTLYWMDGYWREPANALGLKVLPTHYLTIPPPPETP